MSIPARLCNSCRVLQDAETLLEPGVPGQMPYVPMHSLRFHDTWPGLDRLAASGTSGCEFCSFLRERLLSAPNVRPWDAGDPPDVTIDLYVVIDDVLIYNRDSIKPQFVCGFTVRICPEQSDMDVFREVKFLTCLNAQGTKPGIPFLPAPTVEVLSERNVSFAKSALEKCSHVCQHAEPTSFLPTRLLDLGQDPISGEGLRLVTTADILENTVQSAKVKYAALSYCWGDRTAALSQPKTTTATLDSRLTTIDMEEMSPVVRDTIKVCSKLAIRYLWVDALCILQGSDEIAVQDWNRESQQMAKIFKHAFVTLCATSSTSCLEGFLGERQHQVGPVLHIQLRGGNAAETVTDTYSIIPCGPDAIDRDYWRLDSFPYHWQIDASKWYGRGWVHQEMRLSNRLLVFSSNWMFFMCDGLYLCENGLSITREWRSPLAVGISKAAMRDKPFEAFADEVEIFTNKDFTFDTDRLPALASLASMIAGHTGSQYLGGLWRDNLERDLLFSRSVVKNGMKGMTSFRERLSSLSSPDSVARPSWSWAGLPGPCQAGSATMPQTKLRLQCEVVDIDFATRGDNPFTRPERAKLVLRTGVVSLISLMHGRPDEVLRGVLVAHIAQPNPGRSGDPVLFGWDTDNKNVTRGEACDMFLIQVSCSDAYGKSNSGTAGGLIVYPAGIHGEYYRIGLWRTDVGFGWDLPWETKTITLV